VPIDVPKVIEGELTARDLRFGIVVTRFNEFVVEPLLRGALDALKRHGATEKQIEIVRVPGAFDMPIAVRKLAMSRRYEALVALGAVIRARAHRAGVGRTHRFWGADDRYHGTGRRSRRRQGGQQGRGRRARFARDGELVATLGLGRRP
jgi:hypothetical protein